jgi:hypothetical protein
MIINRYDELRGRIQRDLDFFGGVLPERNAIAWGGYLAALGEWDLLLPSDSNKLFSLLPFVKDNPVYGIATGNPGGEIEPEIESDD